ncbi:MAG: chaperone NapD [Proteobacteria bacterium]|nr:chaperone NapD [Pseudomonadota bacterium]MBU1231830.1 chaperone NapD [Pseudomonadota bacterium]MBU1419975.1 chaperone NapD [Pseudomonadota bacterium]MBU1454491.1 chaperone NapD [Pseudomonadota bacterium]
MVVGGFVVQCLPDERNKAAQALSALQGVEVYGDDEQGNVVVVAEADSSGELGEVVKRMEKVDSVLNVGMTYMNMEDEAEQIASGESTPKVFDGRKRKRDSLETP